MGTFQIIETKKDSQYSYRNDDVIVNGEVDESEDGTIVLSIFGSVFVNNSGERGRCIGNFNGQRQEDGTIPFSLSAMSFEDSLLVWAAINEIKMLVLSPADDADSE